MTRIDPVDCTVLIVDDHPSFRASARVLLESEGFNVIGEAVDGASAVAETCRLKPQLVLLDVQLPDIDGFDVAARITGHPDSPAVILVSSRDSSDFGPLVSPLRRARLRPEGRALGRARPGAARFEAARPARWRCWRSRPSWWGCSARP